MAHQSARVHQLVGDTSKCPARLASRYINISRSANHRRHCQPQRTQTQGIILLLLLLFLMPMVLCFSSAWKLMQIMSKWLLVRILHRETLSQKY